MSKVQMSESEKSFKEVYDMIDTVLENQQIIIANQEDILEKLDNISRSGGDYEITDRP